MRRHWILAVGLAAGSIAAAGAQAPAGTSAPTSVNLDMVSNDYQIGPGDQLNIQVVGHNELNETIRVSNSGEISFSTLGLICVADLTAFDVEYAIAERLREKDLIKEPEVLVYVSDYQAKPIYVSGAVVTPGEFVMSQELTVADAILLAGGLRLNAASEGIIHRRVPEQGRGLAGPCGGTSDTSAGTTTLTVNLEPMKEGRFFEAAIALKRGDVIVVPEMRMNPFFVVGELIDPRNFAYAPGQTLMVSQAISWAGGPLATAKLSAGMLVRYDEQGRRTEMDVDYGAILSGKQPDFPIQPYDIIFIPGSGVKTFANAMLMMTDEMAMSTVFRMGRRAQLPDRPDPTIREPR